MDDTILYEVDRGVARITLNRPDKLNAMTAAMLDALGAALADAAADDTVRAVLISGSGRAFCAGQDLNDRTVSPGEDGPDLGASLEDRYNPIVRAMRAMPKPIVVAVNGVAAGAGANLALAGDVVLAARSARFVQSFSRIGLIPDSGGTYTLPRAVGTARAMGLALFGDPLPADKAHEWGLIWDVIEDDQLAVAAKEKALSLAEGPTAGFAAVKEAMNASLGNSLDAQLDLERDLQRAAGRTRDYREGVAAFIEKRPAHFEGR